MEIRLRGTPADTETDANTVIITVSIDAHRKNHGKIQHEKVFFLFTILRYLLI